MTRTPRGEAKRIVIGEFDVTLLNEKDHVRRITLSFLPSHDLNGQRIRLVAEILPTQKRRK